MQSIPSGELKSVRQQSPTPACCSLRFRQNATPMTHYSLPALGHLSVKVRTSLGFSNMVDPSAADPLVTSNMAHHLQNKALTEDPSIGSQASGVSLRPGRQQAGLLQWELQEVWVPAGGNVEGRRGQG